MFVGGEGTVDGGQGLVEVLAWRSCGHGSCGKMDTFLEEIGMGGKVRHVLRTRAMATNISTVHVHDLWFILLNAREDHAEGGKTSLAAWQQTEVPRAEKV